MGTQSTTESTMRLSFPESDIALITLDLPGKSANILSRPVLEELSGRAWVVLAEV